MRWHLLFTIATWFVMPGLAQASTPIQASSPPEADKQQIISWINASAQQKASTDSFSYQYVNLDEDDDLEIVAKENSSVHIGTFYVLDRRSDRQYALIAEKRWNVPQLQMKRWDISSYEEGSGWNRSDPDQVGRIAGKRLFETINHTGGTGIVEYEAHLWYLDNGNLIEAWSDTLQETAYAPGGNAYRTVGSYQLVDSESPPILYYWQTHLKLDPDSGQPLPAAPVTKLEFLTWENGTFQDKSSR